MTKEQFINECLKKDINKVQINEKRNKDTLVRIIDKKIVKFNSSDEIKYSIKGSYNGNNITIETNHLDDEIIDNLIEKGKALEVIYEDLYLEDTSKNNNIEDSKIDLSLNKEIDRAITLMDIKDKYSFIDKINIYLSKEYEQVSISNSNKVNITSDSLIKSCYLEILAKENGIYINEGKNIFFEELDELDKLFAEVLLKTKNSIIKKPINTGKYSIILEPKVFEKIIKNVFSMLEGSNIRLKKSILTDKLNEQIFSNKLTVIEEPTNKDLPGYRLFDEEGTFTYDKEIISNGNINTYLYSNKEALKVDKHSTGNCFSSLTRNAFVKKGSLSYEELIKKMGNGIIITETMGSSNAAINISNGNISLQVFGYIVEDGNIKSGLIPSILTTDIFELLGNIDEIGNDLYFNNISLSTPSVLIKNITITNS